MTRWVERLQNRTRFPVLFVPVSNRFHTNRPDIVLPALAAELSAVLGVTLELPAVGAVEAYRDIIAELLGRFTGADRQCLLVIDGVDETLLAGWELGQALLPAVPPPGLRILVTARRLAGDAGAAGWRARLGWGPTAEVTELDLGVLAQPAVGTLLARIALEERTDLVDADLAELTYQVFRLSDQGDPLLVELYAADIRDALRQGIEDAGMISLRWSRRNAGLRGYFENWMQERFQAFSASQATGLVPLAVAEATLILLASALGPLRHDELVALLQRVIPDQAIPPRADLLRPLARFVLGDGDTIGYTLGHPRFTVFLLEEQYVGAPLLARVEAAFLQWGDEEIDELSVNGGSRRRVAGYLLAWYPWHLLRHPSVKPRRLSRVLSRAWIEAARAGEGEAGFALAAQSILDKLLESIDRAADPDAEAIGSVLRVSLFLASLREAANFSDPGLLSMAFECGVLDQNAIEARLPLLRPAGQVRLLLELAQSTHPGVDTPALWRRARDLAVADSSAERIRMLEEVLRMSRAFDNPSAPGSQISWKETLPILRLRVAVPAGVNSSVLNYLPYPWYGTLDAPELGSIPTARLGELVRLLLEEDSVEPGPLMAMLRAVAAANLHSIAKRVGDPISAARVEILRALIEPLSTDNGRCGRIVRAVLEALNSLLEPMENPQASLQALLSLQLENERIMAIAALLALFAALGGFSTLALAALLGLIEKQMDPVRFAQLVAASPLDELPSEHREFVAVRAWAGAQAATNPMLRNRLWVALAAHDTVDLTAASLAVREEISDRRGFDLLTTLGHRLSEEQLRDLCRELSGWMDADSLSHIVNSVLRKAPTSSRRSLLEQELAAFRRPVSGPLGKLTDDAMIKSEVRSFLSRPSAKRSEKEFEQAVQRVREVANRRVRANLLSDLAREAPDSGKPAIVKEALAAAGAIDDRDVSIEAMAELASALQPDLAEPLLAGLLEALSKLEPRSLVDTVANSAWQLPTSMRQVWAAYAIAAAKSLPPGSSESAAAMARVVNAYGDHAPKAFVAASLRALAVLGTVGGGRAGDIYRWLILSRGWASWPAIVQGLSKVKLLSPEGRAAVLSASIARHPRLLFWARAFAINAVSAISDSMARLEHLVDLARASRGSRRRRLVDRAHGELVKLLDRGPDAHLWVSEFHPVRYLFDLADSAARDKILQEIDCRESSPYAVLYKTCIFPVLSPEERRKAGPALLRVAETPPPPPLDGSIRFNQLRVLFRHWAGEGRRRPLLSLLRIGAGVSRRAWLYGIRDVVRELPDQIRPAVAASLQEAIADATALWP